MNKTKDKFRQFCLKNHQIPLFLRDWWLDHTAGKNNWDVVVLEKDGHIVSFMPFAIKKVGVFTAIGMPLLTPFLGVWIAYPENQNKTAKLSMEKKYFSQLIQQLPKFDKFSAQLDPNITNWLPFYWEGYKQTTCYTYVIENLSDTNHVYENFKGNIKGDISKAKGAIQICESNDIEHFYLICSKTFSRQKKQIPFSFKFISTLFKGIQEYNAGKILTSKDKEGNVHAAALIVWDKQRAYYLLGGGDPQLRNSGATSLLLWEAIKLAATVSNQFDFEGSMIEPIEQFFRGFGGTQKPYFQLTKYNSKTIELADHLRNKLK